MAVGPGLGAAGAGNTPVSDRAEEAPRAQGDSSSYAMFPESPPPRE